MGFDFFILLLLIAIGAYAVSNSIHIAFIFNMQSKVVKYI